MRIYADKYIPFRDNLRHTGAIKIQINLLLTNKTFMKQSEKAIRISMPFLVYHKAVND